MSEKQFLSIYLPGWAVGANSPERTALVREALEKMAAWALRFTPLVAPDDAGLLLDLTGTQRLHGGTEALIEKISSKLERRGIQSRFAAAETIGAAWALARYGADRITIARSGAARAMLAPLPVRALRVPEDTALALREIGVRTIEELLALPRKEIGVRFGAHLLRRIDQALGTVNETFEAFVPEERFFVRRVFESTLSSRNILCSVAAGMTAQLMQRLEREGRSARSFQLVVESRADDGTRASLSRELSPHTANAGAAHLASIIEPICEKLPLTGSVTAVSIVARDTGAAIRTQRGLLPGAEETETARAFTELLDHCAVRLGANGIKRAELRESYIPERSFEYKSSDSHDFACFSPKSCKVVTVTSFDYPPYIFPEAEPATAMALLPDHPPARLTWRSREHEILEGIGPTRVAPEWWIDASANEREYFKLQDGAGRWLWVYRDRGTLEWFVQGVWV